VRESGRPPSVEWIDAPDRMVTAVVDVAGGLVDAGHTSVGVVAVPALHDDLRAAGLDAGVQLVTPPEAKGLEFDGVLVVEPAAIVATTGGDEAAGLRLLYVALTRAVQELVVVHHAPLPAALRRRRTSDSGQ